MTFDISELETRERRKWRQRVSAEDPGYAANFCPDGDCGEYVGFAGQARHDAKVHADRKDFVGPETRVRKGRAGNIDTDRLMTRREYLAKNLKQGRTGTVDSSRIGFAYKAGEMGQIEDELVSRGFMEEGQRQSLSPRQFGGREM